MNNLMQKILIDSAIEYSKNLLLTNENPDICIDDIHSKIIYMFREFKDADIREAIKNKCKKEHTKTLIDKLTKIDDGRCNSYLVFLTLLFTEDSKINLSFDVNRETVLMFNSVLKKFKNLSQFIIYFDSSYIKSLKDYNDVIEVYNNSLLDEE